MSEKQNFQAIVKRADRQLATENVTANTPLRRMDARRAARCTTIDVTVLRPSKRQRKTVKAWCRNHPLLFLPLWALVCLAAGFVFSELVALEVTHHFMRPSADGYSAFAVGVCTLWCGLVFFANTVSAIID